MSWPIKVSSLRTHAYDFGAASQFSLTWQPRTTCSSSSSAESLSISWIFKATGTDPNATHHHHNGISLMLGTLSNVRVHPQYWRGMWHNILYSHKAAVWNGLLRNACVDKTSYFMVWPTLGDRGFSWGYLGGLEFPWPNFPHARKEKPLVPGVLKTIALGQYAHLCTYCNLHLHLLAFWCCVCLHGVI